MCSSTKKCLEHAWVWGEEDHSISVKRYHFLLLTSEFNHGNICDVIGLALHGE